MRFLVSSKSRSSDFEIMSISIGNANPIPMLVPNRPCNSIMRNKFDSVTMAFYPERILEIADLRGFSKDEIPRVSGISLARLDEVLAGRRLPTVRQIVNFADNMAVPYFALFSKEFKPFVFDIVDFRGQYPQALRPQKFTKALFRHTKERDFFAKLYARLDIPAPDSLVSIELEQNPEQMAASIGALLAIDEIRASSEDKKDFFRKLRRSVEKLGVFVICDHNAPSTIDGFALYHNNFTSNYIFLNTGGRNSGRMSFTLAHEVAHILGKRSAISDDYQSNNDVELYCNRFAVNLLLPRSEVLSFISQRKLEFGNFINALSSARVISDYFKTSISSVLVRVAELGISANYYFEFSKDFGTDTHLDSIKPTQGGGPERGPDQGVLAVAYFGERASALIADALAAGVTSKFEVSEILGLSEARIDGITRVAKERGLKL
jgi:Zn-dependent peptidase ImmA (M78 family)